MVDFSFSLYYDGASRDNFQVKSCHKVVMSTFKAVFVLSEVVNANPNDSQV